MNPDNKPAQPPVVLAIGGHDPGGGAGIQADIEAITAHGCHAATALSAITIQDSCSFTTSVAVKPDHMIGQIRATMDDMRVDVIKIGLLGGADIVHALSQLLAEFAEIPVLLDPVLASGSGSRLLDDHCIQLIREQLLPQCSLITPNTNEAARLSGLDHGLEDQAHILLEMGADAALITGTHALDDQVINRLYDQDGLQLSTEWPRLPHEYHGSGCTLTAAISANLALGYELYPAVVAAQQYTWHALSNAYKLGRCQWNPNRRMPNEDD